MADIATVGFRAETDELAEAKKRLEALVPSASKAERASDQLADRMEKSNRASSVFGRSMDLVGGKLRMLGPLLLGVASGFAAAFGVGALINRLQQTAEKIDGIAKAARKLGATTAEMQSLGAAADLAGIGTGQLAQSASRMTVVLAKAARSGKGSEGVFKTLGISAQELLDLPLVERFATIADRIENLGLGSEEILPILAQLGDRGGSLTSLFEGGSEQIRFAADMMQRFNGTVSDADAANIEAMNDAFSMIGYAIDAFYVQLTAALAPVLVPLFTGAAEAIGFMASGLASLLNGTSAWLPVLTETATILAIAFSPLIAGAIAGIVVQVGALAIAMGGSLIGVITAARAAMIAFALSNPFTAVLLALTTLGAAAYAFRDKIKQVFGVDIVASVKSAANFMIGAMVGGYNGIMATWNKLPAAMNDVAIKAANSVINTIQRMALNVLNKINEMLNDINNAAGTSLPLLNPLAMVGKPKSWEIPNANAGAASSVGETLKQEMGKAVGQDYIGGLDTKTFTSEMTTATGAAHGLASAIDGIGTAATGAGGSASAGGGLGGLGGASGGGAAEKLTTLQNLAKEFGTMSEPFNQAQAAFGAAKQALDNGIITNDAYAASLGRIEQAFITAGGSSEQWAKIVGENTSEVAGQMKQLAEQSLTKLGDEFINLAVDGKANFADLAKSIIKDLLKIAWQALVVKPLLNMFGGGGIGGALASANGNVFSGGAPMAFASGGAFTNSVVSGATAFPMGLMGEAGPEAIMPLQRSKDGSLGIQAYGGKSGGGNQTNVVEINNTYVLEGVVSEESMVARIRQTAEETKDETKQKLVGWLSEYSRDGKI